MKTQSIEIVYVILCTFTEVFERSSVYGLLINSTKFELMREIEINEKFLKKVHFLYWECF